MRQRGGFVCVSKHNSLYFMFNPSLQESAAAGTTSLKPLNISEEEEERGPICSGSPVD